MGFNKRMCHVNVWLVMRWNERYGRGNDREIKLSLEAFFPRTWSRKTWGKIRQTNICGYVHPRYIWNEFIRIYHENMLSLFYEKCKIIYTDTNSFIYHECDDVVNKAVLLWNAISIDSIRAIMWSTTLTTFR